MSRPLMILLLAGSLGACATQHAGSPATPPPAAAPAPALVVDPGASPYGLYLAGEAARDAGRLGEAAFYLGRAAAAEGQASDLKAEAFSAALQSGDVSAAAALAPDVSEPGDSAMGTLVRGVEALAQGKNKVAYTFFQDPRLEFPPKTAAQLLAPFAAAGAGDRANATARPDLDGDNVSQFVAELDRAQLLERLGQAKDAEAAYKALIAAGDDGGLVGSAYAGFLERQGRWSEAGAIFRARLARNPNDSIAAEAVARSQARGHAPPLPGLRQGASKALLIPAAALIGQKQDVLALEYLRLALRLDAGNDEAWLLVGDLVAPTDIDAARLAYTNVSPASEDYAAARGKLAWTYENAGDHDIALKLAHDTYAAAPDSRDAAATLADLLRDNGQFSESAQILSQLILKAGPNADWRLYYLRASAYNSLGDAARTQADLDTALARAPDEPELLNFQGYFWIDRGERLPEALAMVQRAAAAQPRSGEIIDSLGWAYYRLGDYTAAVEKLEQAIALDPGIAEVNDHLGDAYWRVGRKTEAQFQWRRVLSLEPDARLKARASAELASPLGPDAPAVTAPPPASAP